MQSDHLVIAVGHTWPNLDIEQRTTNDMMVVDGSALSPDDPTWGRAAGILLGTAAKLDEQKLRQLKEARGVVRYGIGFDNVDIAAADAIGLPIAIVRDYCLDEVAEHGLAMALSLVRALPLWDTNVRAGRWRSGPRPVVRKLSSLAFGVVGFGLIGCKMAEKASSIFGRILVHDPLASITPEHRSAYEFCDKLDQILSEADVLSIHVPLVDGTRALLDAASLARMKQTAYLINVSRGGIVDETALLQAVRTGQIAGAALDTFATEPLPPDHPFIDEPRVLLTPHMAWLSQEAEVKLRERASQEMALMLIGRPPTCPVTRTTVRMFGGDAN